MSAAVRSRLRTWACQSWPPTWAADFPSAWAVWAFIMGLAGTWLLFTGLVGAWLTAVLIIPRIKRLDAKHQFMTYPDFLRHRYNGKVALAAALISGIGYLGFTGAQMLAGAKLASATILPESPVSWMTPITFALVVIAVVTILYTVIGGLKAVIYTDTIQWILLLSGLIFVTIPVTLYEIGGFSALKETLPAEYFSLGNIAPVTFINWMVTIIPIWLVGMTLYQRMYACKDEKTAKKAWYIAGLFEYPIMAFTGVFLGMCGRVVFPEAEAEMALPMLIRDILPIGVTGIVIASYFSAIMSTADSCLMASSGNFVNDLLERYALKNITTKTSIRLSMAATAVIGTLAVVLAAQFTTVLSAILYAYAFMVSGLFVPTLGAYFWKRASSAGALAGMIAGGSVTLAMMIFLPARTPSQLDFSIYGIGASAVVFVVLSLLWPDSAKKKITQSAQSSDTDTIENIEGASVHHGKINNRVYLMKLGTADPVNVISTLETLIAEKRYTKFFAKVPQSAAKAFMDKGFTQEAGIPNFYNGTEDAVFLGKYYDPKRQSEDLAAKYDAVDNITRQKADSTGDQKNNDCSMRLCTPHDTEAMAQLYAQVFDSYPFAIDDPAYLRETMASHIHYFCIEQDGNIVALASSETDPEHGNVEMTDFATRPDHRGKGYAQALLAFMEDNMQSQGLKTAYTIARAISPGMNITFARAGYTFGGRLINNTNIGGKIESMNVWYKPLTEQ